MKYQRFDLNAYNLHILKTKRFKTISLLINFKRPIVKEEVTIRSFLPLILLNSTNQYQTKRKLSIETENLYGVDISYNQRRLGNYALISFNMSLLKEKYTEPGMFKKSLFFLFDILFNPNVSNEAFDSEVFSIVKNEFVSSLKALKDNTMQYGLVKMLEEMDKKAPYSYRVGYLEDVEKITEKDLYNYYQEMLKSDEIDVFILGDIDVNETKRIFKEYFLIKTIKKERQKLFIEHQTYRKRLKKVIEHQKIKQAKLSMGLKIMKLTDFEKKYVMTLYANILGGPSYSKLFKSIREKNSLAYYVFCRYNLADSLLLIGSGINQDSFDKVIRLIKKEIQNIIKGDITEAEINNVKKDIISVIESIEDSPTRTINAYLLKVLLGLDDFSLIKRNYEKVSKEDLIKVGKKIKIDTVHLLCKGD
ncbi:MAG: EF-P 5-aminopentanol modification-associated protein YfmF [Bacilli bacterium]|jgi:predicted Zn-dependent peptidase